MGILIYDKPFKTIDEQINLLRNRNLIILNEDFARKALSTVSYYDLINGYQESMMDNGIFKAGISLEYLFAIHLFDKDFQNVIFKNSILVENIFKTKIAYVLAQNLGIEIEDYLDPKEFLPFYKNLNFYRLKDEFYRIYMRLDRKSNSWSQKDTSYIPQPTRHYAEHHNHIPPWIIMRNLSFSNSINLYRLIKDPHHDMISDLLLPQSGSVMTPDQKTNFLVPAISLIREFRNQVAHNLKFVTHTSDDHRLPVTETNIITANKAITAGRKSLNDLYACIIAMTILLDSKVLRIRFYKDIENVVLSPNLEPDDSEKLLRAELLSDYLVLSKLPGTFLNDMYKLINTLPN